MFQIIKIRALQSHTGKYRELQGNPCNENRDPAIRTGVPCNENRVFPVGIDLQGFPVSCTGFGFAVHHKCHALEQFFKRKNKGQESCCIDKFQLNWFFFSYFKKALALQCTNVRCLEDQKLNFPVENFLLISRLFLFKGPKQS